MNKDEIKLLFDKQAMEYDNHWNKIAPIKDCLNFFLESILAELPRAARILCVGAGTGQEVVFLASRFPSWNFTVAEPSGAMLQVCRKSIEEAGFSSRCYFHEGYLDTLSIGQKHDAATSLLVSQFILVPEERIEFFRHIANQLKPQGVLVSSDLASNTFSDNYEKLLRVWLSAMPGATVTNDNITRVKDTYARGVAIVPPKEIASIMASGGFEPPIQFYQAGLIHAFIAKREAA